MDELSQNRNRLPACVLRDIVSAQDDAVFSGLLTLYLSVAMGSSQNELVVD